MISSIISSIYLLVNPSAIHQPAVDPAVADAIRTIRERHLETPAGRIEFLTRELQPFLNRANDLNNEIKALSVTVSKAEIKEDIASKEEILAMAQKTADKMDAFQKEILPMIASAFLIDADFQRIDSVLAKPESLENQDKEMLLRVAELCKFLSEFGKNKD